MTLVPGFLSAQTSVASDPLEVLVRDSPFLPAAGGGARAAPGETGPLELRGVVFEDGAYRFSIYDQASREAAWVRLAEGGYPFVARSFNRERDTLTVDHQGRTLVLTLQASKMQNGGAGLGNQPGSAPPPLPAGGEGGRVPAATGNTTAPGPNGPPIPASAVNPQEAQRLQNMADEIRRRRSLPPIQLPKKS